MVISNTNVSSNDRLKLLIVGASGAGKTSLAKTILELGQQLKEANAKLARVEELHLSIVDKLLAQAEEANKKIEKMKCVENCKHYEWVDYDCGCCHGENCALDVNGCGGEPCEKWEAK